MSETTFKKISQMNNIQDSEIIDTVKIPCVSGVSNFIISWFQIKKAILETVGGVLRTIGLNTAGSIVTTDANQPLTNKTLLYPFLNSIIRLTVKSEELNHCANLSSNVKNEMDSLDSRLTIVEGGLNGISPSTRVYRTSFSSAIGVVSKTLSYGDLLTEAGLSGVSILSNSITIQVYSKQMLTMMIPFATVEIGLVDGHEEYIDNITVSDISGTEEHIFVIDFKISA